MAYSLQNPPPSFLNNGIKFQQHSSRIHKSLLATTPKTGAPQLNIILVGNLSAVVGSQYMMLAIDLMEIR